MQFLVRTSLITKFSSNEIGDYDSIILIKLTKVSIDKALLLILSLLVLIIAIPASVN